MRYRWETMAAIAAQRVVGIVRSDDPQTAAAAARRLISAGLTAVEISLTTPDALDVIRDLAGADASVGAGTVLDAPSARLAVAAGASFLISPSFDPEVVQTGHRYGAAVIPGVSSATEIVAALSAGADAVKLYPASAASPAVLRDLLAPLPQTPVIPTGGIALDDARSWIDAGAVAVGLGSALTRGAPEEIEQRIRSLLAALAHQEDQ
jgi:2-dehydro-3-deoxyphosphogluconate aldolase/(4S)-4-hydroxy-2-oxoglutarate aldolase